MIFTRNPSGQGRSMQRRRITTGSGPLPLFFLRAWDRTEGAPGRGIYLASPPSSAGRAGPSAVWTVFFSSLRCFFSSFFFFFAISFWCFWKLKFGFPNGLLLSSEDICSTTPLYRDVRTMYTPK